MENITKYEAKCKSCGWVFAENKIPKIDNMPSKCQKCVKGDMAVLPVFKRDGKGRTYELRIFCKETGVDIGDGAIITEEEMLKLDIKKLETLIVTNLSEAFANLMSNPAKLSKLIAQK